MRPRRLRARTAYFKINIVYVSERVHVVGDEACDRTAVPE